jgi:ABC-type amino acid transport system permease subunit
MLVMATYLAMSLFTSLIMNLYNRYVQVLEK